MLTLSSIPALDRVYRIWFLVISCLLAGVVESSTSGNGQLQAWMETLEQKGTLELQGATITSQQFLPEFYRQRGFVPAWSGKTDGAREFSGLVSESHRDGLVPADYYAPLIKRLLADRDAGDLSEREVVELDVILTASLSRYAYHMRFGKVNPARLDADWNIERSFNGLDPVTEIQAVIDADSPAKRLEAGIAQLPGYPRLKAALARYVAIRDAGGWPAVPDGQTLKPGMQDPRVSVLRQRLQVTGDHGDSAPGGDSELFDDALAQAVIHFQQRHGLDADGLVGKGTLAALNVPVEARIDQIRVNLERARWVSHNIPSTFVIVDIAGFNARLIRDGEVIWDEPAQVGKPYRKTPVFREDMTYLEINPTWTVPPTILAKDILPKVRKDPAYLASKNMQVLTHGGEVVDPATIDWSSFSGRGFPYIIRQTPGPHNALGRVKFMFPNPHFVYLHDTPSKELFNHSSRAFSSGCIRVRNPYRLAELLLQDPDKWDIEGVEAAVDTLKLQRVNLPEPVPVLLLYWTVTVKEDGTVQFKEDIYQRDAKVLAGLEGAYRFEPPADSPEWLKK